MYDPSFSSLVFVAIDLETGQWQSKFCSLLGESCHMIYVDKCWLTIVAFPMKTCGLLSDKFSCEWRLVCQFV